MTVDLWLCFLVTLTLFARLGIAKNEEMSLNFLHTTDIHGWAQGHRHNDYAKNGMGELMSFMHYQRTMAKNQGYDHIAIDTGDFLQGTGLSDATDPPGYLILEAVKKLPYDLLTIGNHELGIPEAMTYIRDNWTETDTYVNTNSFFVNEQGIKRNIGASHKFLTTESGHRLLVLGLIDPVSHMPEFLYNSDPLDAINSTDSAVRPIIESRDFDGVILLLHIGLTSASTNNSEWAIRNLWPEHVRTKIPMFVFTGHTHMTRFDQSSDANTVYIESGCYLYSSGILSVKFNLSVMEFTSVAREWVATDQDKMREYLGMSDIPYDEWMTDDGFAMLAWIQKEREYLGLTERFGCSESTFSKSKLLQDKGSMFALYMEHFIPNYVLVTPIKYEGKENAPVYFLNTGSVRSNLFAGEIIKDDLFTLDPFNSSFYYIPNLTPDQLEKIFEIIQPWDTPLPNSNSPINDRPPHYYRTSVPKAERYAIVGTDYDTARCVDQLEVLFPSETWENLRYGDGFFRNYLEDFLKNDFHCQFDPDSMVKTVIIVCAIIVILVALVTITVTIHIKRKPVEASIDYRRIGKFTMKSPSTQPLTAGDRTTPVSLP